MNFMVYHADKRYHAVGYGIDEFFKSTVPLLWLTVFFFCLFYMNYYGVQITLGVIVLIWVAMLIANVAMLVRKSFFKEARSQE